MKIKVEELGCFGQVAKVIGVERAKVELCDVIENISQDDIWDFDDKDLVFAFSWKATTQGLYFWQKIDNGVDPYEG